MGSCCGYDTTKIYKLDVDGNMIGLAGVEQAFLDVLALDLNGDEAAEKLLELVKKSNYVPKCAETEYKKAIYADYKKYIADPKKLRTSDSGACCQL